MTQPLATPAPQPSTEPPVAADAAGRATGNPADDARPSNRFDRLLTPAGAAVACLLVLAVVLFARERGWLFTGEARLLDQLMLLRAQNAAAEPGPCVVVRISERDIRDLMQQYPIGDRLLADAVDRIADAGPRVIGIDLFRDIPVPDREGFAAERLEAVLKARRNVVGIYLINPDEDWVGPPPALRGTQRAGFNNVPEDADGRVRRALLYDDDPKNLMGRDLPPGETVAASEPAFALLLALRYLRADGITLEPLDDDPAAPTLKLGGALLRRPATTLGGYVASLPEPCRPRNYELLLDLRTRWPVEELDLTELFSPAFDPSRLKERIVLFGVRTTSVKDYLPTALDTYTPGVAMQAIIADQLVRAARGRDPARPRVAGVDAWGDMAESAWIAGWCGVGGAIGLLVRSAGRAVLLAGAAAAVLAAAAYAAARADVWIPLLPPAIGLAASAGLVAAWVSARESADRRAWAALTGKLVSPEIAAALWQSRRELFDHGRMRPRKMTATVLFFDLKGFTAMSERVSPEEMIGLLNELFQEMSTTVEAHGGVVNKYVGDQIMALFGPPLPRTTEAHHRQDAQNAVRCAAALRQKLVEVNARWRPLGRPTISMRIGIFTGPLVAGSLGSRDRLEYTVIGPTVNTASRLESAAKDLFDDRIAPGNCRILIGQPTKDRLDDTFRVVPVEVGEMKGISEAFGVYAVV